MPTVSESDGILHSHNKRLGGPHGRLGLTIIRVTQVFIKHANNRDSPAAAHRAWSVPLAKGVWVRT